MKTILSFLKEEHDRVDAYFKAAVENDNIDREKYDLFRKALLRHIKQEEKVLFPAAKIANNGESVPLFAQLRAEHGALTALMVPPPTEELLFVINYILELHDEKEKGRGGVYDFCDKLEALETNKIIKELEAVEEVPIHPCNTDPSAMEAAKRALQRAGYDYDEISSKMYKK